MNFLTKFSAVLLILVLAFSTFGMALTLFPQYERYCKTYHGSLKCYWRAIEPNNSGELTSDLTVRVTGLGNSKKVEGKIYAQVGLGPGELRATASGSSGALVFKNLKASRWYFLVLKGNGRTTVHPFVFVPNRDSTVTRFV